MRCCCENCGWLEVNPSGAMFCGYSDQRTWKDESCLAWKDKDEPQTNADRIRAMSDEELADWIELLCPSNCPDEQMGEACARTSCDGCWLSWLKSPVEGGEE